MSRRLRALDVERSALAQRAGDGPPGGVLVDLEVLRPDDDDVDGMQLRGQSHVDVAGEFQWLALVLDDEGCPGRCPRSSLRGPRSRRGSLVRGRLFVPRSRRASGGRGRRGRRRRCRSWAFLTVESGWFSLGSGTHYRTLRSAWSAGGVAVGRWGLGNATGGAGGGLGAARGAGAAGGVPPGRSHRFRSTGTPRRLTGAGDFVGGGTDGMDRPCGSAQRDDLEEMARSNAFARRIRPACRDRAAPRRQDRWQFL